MLKVNEIFYSIQGESTFAGKPCVFIRLTFCNLRCTYCDTEYAFYDGTDMTLEEIISNVQQYDCNLVEVTGGEPLMQSESIPLMAKLIEKGFTVLLETGGSLPVKDVPPKVIKIVDFKCPSSRMEQKNSWEILDDLNEGDEIKFVVGDRQDYDWVKEMIIQHQLLNRWTILISPVFDKIENQVLAEWIISDHLPVRFQLQMHKYIWHPESKGV